MDEYPIIPDIGVTEVTDERTENDLGHVTGSLEVINENEDRLDDSFYQIFWVNII